MNHHYDSCNMFHPVSLQGMCFHSLVSVLIVGIKILHVNEFSLEAIDLNYRPNCQPFYCFTIIIFFMVKIFSPLEDSRPQVLISPASR